MAKLTIQVLDTSRGKPAAGVAVELYRLHEDRRELLIRGLTSHEGRNHSPLLAEGTMLAGLYELDCHVGDYFATLGVTLPEPRFLDVISVRFGIADNSRDLHVPMLISPYGYSVASAR
ncbi:hydroxyisourate hydrolase [Dokdonella sp.]|uniref:hydroxyisourate hydrolase n=1 Tax=Dokdonella sp. TaxID=2291710 RepID=UPI003529B9D9